MNQAQTIACTTPTWRCETVCDSVAAAGDAATSGHRQPQHAPVAQELSDAQHVARALADPSAFDALFEAHGDAIGTYVYRRTGDWHLTNDLVADVFVAAMTSLKRWHPCGVPFRHWLLVIASRTLQRWARARRRELRRTMRWYERMGAQRSTAPPAAVDFERSREMHSIQNALQMLSPKEQTLLVLHHVEGLTVQQLACAMRMREGTVKSRLFRARASLRAMLKRQEGETSS